MWYILCKKPRKYRNYFQTGFTKESAKALDNKNNFGAELVAFPQHGVYYTDSAPWMKEAAQTDIDYIGG